MNESDATVSTEHISDSVNARLQLQSQRMDEMSNIVHEARKTSVDNAETMQEIRIAIENLGDNFQKMQEKMLQWDEPEQFMDAEEECCICQGSLEACRLFEPCARIVGSCASHFLSPCRLSQGYNVTLVLIGMMLL